MGKRSLVIAITGASSGIGRALAYEYAKHGHHLSLCARSQDTLKQLKKDIEAKYNSKVHIQKVDVTQQEEVKAWISSAWSSFQQLDVLINNAGISMRALFKELNIEVIKRVMDVNF